MGTSHPETKPWVIDRILASHARCVLDVGAGAGNWLDHLRDAGFVGQVHAVEVWQPYITQFRLAERYDRVWNADARALGKARFAWYDVVIFGDILEHMTKEEAVAVWQRASMAPHAAIAIPIVHYPQGHLSGNPFEEHVKDDWSHDEVLASFPGITDSAVFTVTGAYWR